MLGEHLVLVPVSMLKVFSTWGIRIGYFSVFLFRGYAVF